MLFLTALSLEDPAPEVPFFKDLFFWIFLASTFLKASSFWPFVKGLLCRTFFKVCGFIFPTFLGAMSFFQRILYNLKNLNDAKKWLRNNAPMCWSIVLCCLLIHLLCACSVSFVARSRLNLEPKVRKQQQTLWKDLWKKVWYFSYRKYSNGFFSPQKFKIQNLMKSDEIMIFIRFHQILGFEFFFEIVKKEIHEHLNS